MTAKLTTQRPDPQPLGEESRRRGYHFEPAREDDFPDSGWTTERPRNRGTPYALAADRCRAMDHRKSCGRPAAAWLLRGGYHSPARWWAYCEIPEHLYGRWFEDGVLMRWRLIAPPEAPPAAPR